MALNSRSYLFWHQPPAYRKLPQTQPVVLQKFNASKGVVTEMLIDSSQLMMLTLQMMMKDSTLLQLLSASEYALVDSVFKAEVKNVG